MFDEFMLHKLQVLSQGSAMQQWPVFGHQQWGMLQANYLLQTGEYFPVAITTSGTNWYGHVMCMADKRIPKKML